MRKQQQEESEEDQASLLPIKNHIKRIEEMLVLLNNDLVNDAKDIDKNRQDIRSLGEAQNKERTELHNSLLDHCHKIVTDMRELNQQSKSETYNLKQQLSCLNQDKIRLQQNLIVLENKVIETDKDIGFKRRNQQLNKKK
ncbi:unnamed protein product [Paramecium octaurelia]|uniref:Uncharacterized protein n=1 Tax=Paramecium octaurelia TaxID=43137 RepID=A0A8S1TTF3_PAROT|nr:unnamed protein product [Paramecium octaurelia]